MTSLQIARAGVRPLDSAEATRLAADFDDQHCVRLPRLLEPRLLEILQQRIDRHDAWKPHVHRLVHGESTELVFGDDATLGLLSALFNDPAVFRDVRAITGCDPIAAFQGRIYRMDPGTHHDVWHTDANGNYMVALSLNLTREPFEGGELRLRERAGGRLRAQVANTGPGDAIVFRIDGALEHVVGPVTGRTPKVAWAGWFQRETWIPELRRLAGL